MKCLSDDFEIWKQNFFSSTRFIKKQVNRRPIADIGYSLVSIKRTVRLAVQGFDFEIVQYV